jgi:hypothetical protein
MKQNNIFEYIASYWQWADDNPDKNCPGTIAVYFFILRIANNLRWKDKFGITSREVMDGTGISSYNTYKRHFDTLVESGLLKIDRPGANQYQCNIIALSIFDKALTTALSNFDKAQQKHVRHSKEDKDSKEENNKNNKDTNPNFEKMTHEQKIAAQKAITKKVEAANQFRSRWWKTATAHQFKERIDQFRKQYPDVIYPKQFWQDFTDHYTNEHEDGGIRLNQFQSFTLENKIREYHSIHKARYEVKSEQAVPKFRNLI